MKTCLNETPSEMSRAAETKNLQRFISRLVVQRRRKRMRENKSHRGYKMPQKVIKRNKDHYKRLAHVFCKHFYVAYHISEIDIKTSGKYYSLPASITIKTAVCNIWFIQMCVFTGCNLDLNYFFMFLRPPFSFSIFIQTLKVYLIQMVDSRK